MATLEEIREAVRVTIEENLDGVKCYKNIPENALVLPAVIVQPDMADFDVAMGRGTDQYDFTLLVLVGYNHIETAQAKLDPFVTGSGPKSVRQCIFNNKTLGIAGDVNAHVSRMFDYGMRFSPDTQGRGTETLGARLALTVFTRGTS